MIGRELILAYIKENNYFSYSNESIYIEDIDLLDDVVYVAYTNDEGETDGFSVELLELLEFVYKSNKGDFNV